MSGVQCDGCRQRAFSRMPISRLRTLGTALHYAGSVALCPIATAQAISERPTASLHSVTWQVTDWCDDCDVPFDSRSTVVVFRGYPLQVRQRNWVHRAGHDWRHLLYMPLKIHSNLNEKKYFSLISLHFSKTVRKTPEKIITSLPVNCCWQDDIINK